MALRVRRAGPDDLDDVGALTRRNRRRLADFDPSFWRMAEGADELHPLWLGHLLASPDAVARVVVDGDEVVACGICVRQPAQWFADDLATAADERWADAGRLLLEHIDQRPALACIPHRDRARAAAAADAGWEHVSDYRTIRLDPGTPPPPGSGSAVAPDLPSAAPHTFGGPLDPTVPVAAPPIYDPGGTSCIADRVAGGPHLDELVAAAAAAGAGQLIVVCAVDDDDLRRALDERGAGHPVEVHRAPTG